MTVYSVYRPRPGDGSAPVAIPDRFSWFAFLLPPVFMVVHRLWLALAIYIAVIVTFSFLQPLVGREVTVLVYLLLAGLIGLEASALRRMALARQNFGFAGDVVAPARDLAELEALKLADGQA